jgi:hypothetical protein
MSPSPFPSRTSPATSRNPSQGEVSSLSMSWHRWILIGHPRTNHLVKGYLSIWSVQISLDLTSHNIDPTELVRSNRKLPRVGSRFKLDSNRSLKPDLIQIFGNSYLLICNSKNNKWYTVGILRTYRIQYYNNILYFMCSIWNYFQIGIKPSVSLLNSYLLFC